VASDIYAAFGRCARERLGAQSLGVSCGLAEVVADGKPGEHVAQVLERIQRMLTA
jgi:hypothetical protein